MESEGRTVKIVDVQDIYDEFNAGITGPEPIQNFLRYAYNNWNNPQLSHVILLGEERMIIAITVLPEYIISFRLRRPGHINMALLQVTLYGCIVGTDIIPDISVARISVWKDSKFWIMLPKQLPIAIIRKPHALEQSLNFLLRRENNRQQRSVCSTIGTHHPQDHS